MYTIKITVEGGSVVEVDGLPDGFDYEIIDKDELPPAKENKPQAGKLYALTGVPGSKCIANGNTWEESVGGEEVKPNWSYRKNKDGFMGSENRIMKK